MLTGLIAILLLALGQNARAADDPRALIGRAIREMGRKDLLTRKVALHLKLKGQTEDRWGEYAELTCDLWQQVGGNAMRMNMNFPVDRWGTKASVGHVVNGEKAWWEREGVPLAGSATGRSYLLAWQHQERVVSLVPLLEDKGFTFTALPDTKVDGRPARGVKVSFKDRPDVSLYFDKANGLLVKYGCRMNTTGTDKLSLNEVILRDYRPAHGAVEERLLRSANVQTDAKGLLAFLQRHVAGPDVLAKARALVAKLGHDDFGERERAEKELIALGAPALPFLRAAAKSGDLEVVRRAQRCLKVIEARMGPNLTIAAIHLAALRQPPGTVEALLAMLAGADEPVVRELRAALADLAERDAAARALLTKALKDKEPVRRTAAEVALGKDGGAYLKQPGRRLFVPGLRQAMKQVSLVDGTPDGRELEVVEVRCFNRLDDKLFTKPGG
jgi:hypothetical protein